MGKKLKYTITVETDLDLRNYEGVGVEDLAVLDIPSDGKVTTAEEALKLERHWHEEGHIDIGDVLSDAEGVKVVIDLVYTEEDEYPSKEEIHAEEQYEADKDLVGELADAELARLDEKAGITINPVVTDPAPRIVAYDDGCHQGQVRRW